MSAVIQASADMDLEDRGNAIAHLRECCGAFLRHEELPAEPTGLRAAYDEITWAFWSDNAKMREDVREALRRQRREETEHERAERAATLTKDPKGS
jgi:hypothetical protein